MSAVRLWVIALLLLSSTLARADNQLNAEVAHLAQDPQWLALLHYNTSWHGTYQGMADDLRFYLHNSTMPIPSPEQELFATLQAMQAVDVTDPNEHAQCRFPARLKFLAQNIPHLKNQLPTIDCPKYQAWRQNFVPERAYLLFPSAAINNPPAMFGHTLLRLESPKGGEHAELLDFTVNYGADYNGETGLRYAWRGITGHYPGRFDILRYYVEKTSYNDYRDRDIWEYQLKLTPAEIDLMLAHLWELQTIRFDYFFFDENCSYQLLTLIHAVKPQLNLIHELDIYAIPADALRVLAKRDLLSYQQYHPSLSHRIEQFGATLLQKSQTRAQELVYSNAFDTKIQQATAEELTLAYIVALRAQYQNSSRPQDIRERLHTLASARAQHPAASSPPPQPPPTMRPEQGHETSRFRFGYHEQKHEERITASWRAAYHDLLDPQQGYPDGAQIDFLDLGLQYNISKQQLAVDHFTVVDIWSLAPWHYGLRPWSWHVALRYADSQPAWLGHGTSAELGLGLTAQSDWGQFFALAHIEEVLAPALDQNHTLQGGGQIGWLSPSLGPWRHLLTLTQGYSLAGDDADLRQIAWQQRLQLSKTYAVRVNWQRDNRDHIGVNEISAMLERYF